MEIAFKPPWLMTDVNYWVNNFIDLVFAIDIIISFRTTYVSSDTGAEEISGLKIAKNYIMGRFLIDLLSTIPFDKLQPTHYHEGVVETSQHYAIISCLKLIRVLRLEKLISHSNTSEYYKI
jgi:hypothetical protein